MDILNLQENNLAYKKNYPWRKRFSEMLKIRNFRELGEMKRAQELRIDEFSVQKSRESHETIQRLTSQLRSMQEQMN